MSHVSSHNQPVRPHPACLSLSRDSSSLARLKAQMTCLLFHLQILL